MPRIARGVVEMGYFHLLNRGNHRQMLFRQSDDFALFLELLGQSVAKFAVELWGYCLMGNHWHLAVSVDQKDELSRWMHWLTNRHVRMVHARNARLGGGHLYQGRYKSFPVQTRPSLDGAAAMWRPISARAPGQARGRLALVQPVDATGLQRPDRSRAPKARPLAEGCALAQGRQRSPGGGAAGLASGAA